MVDYVNLQCPSTYLAVNLLQSRHCILPDCGVCLLCCEISTEQLESFCSVERVPLFQEVQCFLHLRL